MAQEDNRFTVFLNSDCNLECTYCYARPYRKSHTAIDVNFAKAGIRDHFSKGLYHIRFFSSGEPSLAFKTLVELYEYAYGLAGDQLIAEIQTNGVMSANKAVWIGKHIHNIWISWDGTPDMHDRYRVLNSGKGSASLIEKNVHLMLEAKKTAPGFVGARSTITAYSVYRQCELIDYFQSKGIKYIYAAPVSNDGQTDDPNVEESLAHRVYCDEFLKAYAYAEELGIFYGSFYTRNFDKECNVFCRAYLAAPHLTTDGDVSCCEICAEFVPDHFKPVIFGTWDEKTGTIIYDQDKIDVIKSRRVSNLPKCQECDCAKFCGGGCMGYVLLQEKDFTSETHDYHCEITQYLASKLPVGKMEIPVLHP